MCVCVYAGARHVLTPCQDLYKHWVDPVQEHVWSRLAVCDIGKVLVGRTMNGNSQPYAWLLCLFLRAMRGRHVWHKCVTAAMGPADNDFRFTTYLTRSDEAFIILALEAKGRHWSANIEEQKAAAWSKMKASNRCNKCECSIVTCVPCLSPTHALVSCCVC